MHFAAVKVGGGILHTGLSCVWVNVVYVDVLSTECRTESQHKDSLETNVMHAVYIYVISMSCVPVKN